MIDIVETLRQGSLSRDDYRWIAAEEITRFRAEIEDYKRWAAQVTVEANEEVSSLRSDNERLRAALKPILNYPNIREKIGNQLYGLGCAALEAKRISEADGQPAPGKEEA